MVSKYPPVDCPRFEHCNINRCILDPDYKKRENLPDDYSVKKKEKCISKTIRKRIALKYNLANGGLTDREISSAKRWENLSPEVKQVRSAKLRENSPFIRLKQKGYAITRVGKNEPQLTLTTELEPPLSSPEKQSSEGMGFPNSYEEPDVEEEKC